MCIFTNLPDVSYKDEKASIQDSKGSGGKEVLRLKPYNISWIIQWLLNAWNLKQRKSRFNFVRIKLSNHLSRMPGNSHVRFLEGKAAATPPTHSINRLYFFISNIIVDFRETLVSFFIKYMLPVDALWGFRTPPQLLGNPPRCFSWFCLKKPR